MKYTTLNKIKEYDPCRDGWSKLLKYLGKKGTDDKRLYFKTILKSNGIKDAVWALRTLAYKDYCLFLADVAESVLHIFEHKYPDDDRPRKAIRAVRDYHGGKIDKNELFDAASSAAYAAYAASSAFAAAYAASSAYAAAAYALVSAADANAANAANANAVNTAEVMHWCWKNNVVLGSENVCESNSPKTVVNNSSSLSILFSNANANAAKNWKEIETLFIKHFC